jgi:hypothetical protein
MRLLFALILVALTILPSTMARPVLGDGAILVTPVRPVTVAMFVPQEGRVVLLVDVAQGAYEGLALRADDACRGAHDMAVGANAPKTDPDVPVELPDDDQVTIHCGVMKPGWYVLEFTVEAGLARLAASASGATLH